VNIRVFATAVLYYTRFAWRDFIGKPIPVFGGLSITDVCNFNCIHCWRSNAGVGHQPFGAVQQAVDELFRRGVRYLYIQGGEPYTYEHEGKTVVDVVEYANALGFFHVGVITNGSFPLVADCDVHWVSLDGLADAHNVVRERFEQVIAHVRAAAARTIYANLTLNRANKHDLRALVTFVADTPEIRGVSVNFHVPYPGVEDLLLTADERREACEIAIELKRQGAPVLNTVTGLRALASGDWRRPLPYAIVSDAREFYVCCRANGVLDVCEHCGYAGCAEISVWRRHTVFEAIASLRSIHGWRTFRTGNRS